MKNLAGVAIMSVLVSGSTLAGGDPEFVPFPEGYKDGFSNYATVNRMNGKQLARLYANDKAVAGVRAGGETAEGAVVVMEIYKIRKDAEGNPVKDAAGLFVPEGLAAIAVMQKSGSWPEGFPAGHRAGDWGFALYTPNGEPKPNELECAGCHIPKKDQDYLFTWSQLKAYVQSR
ncbi:MAG: hypothetical protein D6786_02370 [Gammaproteobacteria bacterium]|nr:MAG: hypothetical protein D6786_02370 [Gammaproteobacteria bacterium]